MSGLTWTPGTIGVPFPQAQVCGPNSGLGQTVQITVTVFDPSGVGSVTLRVQRDGDASPVDVAMSPSGGDYLVDLSTANGSSSWYPTGNNQSYVVLLGVQAIDGLGNITTTALVSSFTVTFCQ